MSNPQKINIHDCPECNTRYEGIISNDMECENCGYRNMCHDCLRDTVWGYICTCDIQ